MKSSRRPPVSTAARVHQRIRARGRGSVFVPRDFLGMDSASREAVDAAVGRLADAGTIRRISRGVYDFPKRSRFGLRTPSSDAVAAAIARSTGEPICHGDAKAANLLGLSTQVPAQAVYLTTGTSRVLRVDLGSGRGFDIRFKRVSPGRMLGGDSVPGLVLRALQFVGRNGIDAAAMRRLRAALGEQDLRGLRDLRHQATGWKRDVIDSLMPSSSPSQVIDGKSSAAQPVA